VTATLRRETGVTAASGFRASGVHCGIRKGRSDLALIVSDREASAAAVFTRNLVVAAPVTLSRHALELSGGHARAIVVNSGNANCCTGEQGAAAAQRTAEEVARLLGLPVEQVLVSSTGVIGEQLPIDKLIAGLPAAIAALTAGSGGADASHAILTTDTRAKESVRRVKGPFGEFVIGAMAKGSGMIHPDMATTLAFVTTDAAAGPAVLRASLVRSADLSFNRVTVDGDTSTNDMIAILANGASGVDVESDPDASAAFATALTEVLVDLAREVARDGEGATRLITVTVTGAASESDALTVSRCVAGSPLVKTAIHGADANWGRVIAAAGRSGAFIRPECLTLQMNGLTVLSPGYHSDYSEKEASRLLSHDEVTIHLDLGAGSAEATTWTCDLTRKYIDINARYRT
jgi:glutamate N-acetyltransferase/amino-acid N-acetyltransferase